MSKTSNQRDYVFDNIKAILIILVYIGHCFTSLEEDGLATTYITTIIYSFHIPVFVIISGYLANSKKTKISIPKFIQLFFIVTSICVFTYAVLKNECRFNYYYLPYVHLWYMVSMAFWLLLTPLLDIISFKISIPVSVMLMMLSSYIPLERELSFQRTFSFLPFFVFGYFLRKNESLLLRIKDNKRVALYSGCIITILFFVIVINKYHYIVFCMYHSNDSWGSPLRGMCIKCLAVFCGLAVTLFLIAVIPNKKIRVLSYIGKNTLPIYIGHYFIIEILKYYNLPYYVLILTGVPIIALLSSKPVIMFFNMISNVSWINYIHTHINSIYKSKEYINQ